MSGARAMGLVLGTEWGCVDMGVLVFGVGFMELLVGVGRGFDGFVPGF